MSNFKQSSSLYMMNRDLSWLQFNLRVLDESANTDNPIMERLRFLHIFSNNLDEFFMIRIGSLFDILRIKKDAIDMRTGDKMSNVIKMLYKMIRPMIEYFDQTYQKTIESLKEHDIHILDYTELNAVEKELVKDYFNNDIKPLLSPQVIDAHHPFPHILNKTPYIGLKMDRKDRQVLGLIPIPKSIHEVFCLHQDEMKYIRTEDIILHHAHHIFSMYKVHERTIFSITRNADLNFYDEIIDDATNVRLKIKQLLNQRKTLNPVRLELSSELSDDFTQFLMDRFNIKKYQVYHIKSPMLLSFLQTLLTPQYVQNHPALIYPSFKPVWPLHISREQSIMKQLLKKDILLHFPYESMEPYLKLIKEAADHPDVVSIKITIYRLAKTAKLIEYLSRAAENGKDVLVIIELRARFDEQNNIDWSERLERAGCKIIYGLDIYKVHSKITLITYKKDDKITYFTQVGTGNFNEKTVEQYDDISLMTSHYEIGQDALSFFTNLSISNEDGEYKHFLVSPMQLKQKVLKLIHQEKEKGSEGYIRMKLNAITDVDFIEAIKDASNAGVKIDLIVRSICCIKPHVEGYTEHVTAKSIVGRFLEHSRIYTFGKGDDTLIYISSADMMTRNTERRVEVACPIYQKDLKMHIITLLDDYMKDQTKGRYISKEGLHHAYPKDEQAFNVQNYLLAFYQKDSK